MSILFIKIFKIKNKPLDKDLFLFQFGIFYLSE
nr:MAG TPA: hypothetical protein [Caudoviricetes sp.]